MIYELRTPELDLILRTESENELDDFVMNRYGKFIDEFGVDSLPDYFGSRHLVYYNPGDSEEVFTIVYKKDVGIRPFQSGFNRYITFVNKESKFRAWNALCRVFGVTIESAEDIYADVSRGEIFEVRVNHEQEQILAEAGWEVLENPVHHPGVVFVEYENRTTSSVMALIEFSSKYKVFLAKEIDIELKKGARYFLPGEFSMADVRELSESGIVVIHYL